MVLSLEGLTVRYGSFVALKSFTLQFQGGLMGLLGPNGAGKSTLIRTILGLLKPSEGNGLVLGLDIRSHGLAIRQGIGYMPERDCFIPAMSGVRSIQYAAELSGLSARQARQRAHEVAHWVGLGDERYRPVDSYSTGMKQRVKFGQAIVHNPKLLFLDEPTNGLDPVGHRQMLELIAQIGKRAGIHIILATHLLPDVETICDQVAVIEKGELKRFGSIQELQKQQQLSFKLRLSGPIEQFSSAAQKNGLTVLSQKSAEFLVSLPQGEKTGCVFRAAAESSCSVTELRENRRSLQEVFMESLEPKEAPHASA